VIYVTSHESIGGLCRGRILLGLRWLLAYSSQRFGSQISDELGVPCKQSSQFVEQSWHFRIIRIGGTLAQFFDAVFDRMCFHDYDSSREETVGAIQGRL
jgi:hypothetical protein